MVGIDIGTKTGIATLYGSSVSAGTVKLATKEETTAAQVSTCDPRFARLRQVLVDVLTPACVTLRVPSVVVAWEEVTFASTQYQYRTWVMLRSAVWAALDVIDPGGTIQRGAIAVGTLKNFATGSGAADKDAMARAATSKGFDVAHLDDNAVDALWVALWAEHLWHTSKQSQVP